MKKRNILLVVIVFFFLLCWKLPFYILLSGVSLPEDAIVIKRQVTLTDACYWHIVAEVVFVSNQEYDNIKETILDKNRIIMGESLDPMDCTDWSIMNWAAVSESCCGSYISVKEMDELATRYIGYQDWYCVSFSMMGKALRVFFCLWIGLIFIVIAVIGMVYGIKRKKRIDYDKIEE